MSPLEHGYSRKAIGDNIRREVQAGRPQRQAVAIAYSEARRAARARHKRPTYLYRRNPSGGGLLPLLVLGGVAFLFLKGRQPSSPTSTTPAPGTGSRSPFGGAIATPVPVPVPAGTALPPAAPMGAGPGGWALSAGGPTGQQWVWVSAPDSSTLFAPASVPIPGANVSAPPTPTGAGGGAWRLVAGGPTGEEWTWVSA